MFTRSGFETREARLQALLRAKETEVQLLRERVQELAATPAHDARRTEQIRAACRLAHERPGAARVLTDAELLMVGLILDRREFWAAADAPSALAAVCQLSAADRAMALRIQQEGIYHAAT